MIKFKSYPCILEAFADDSLTPSSLLMRQGAVVDSVDHDQIAHSVQCDL